MKYKCDIKFMAVPSRMQNVVTLCNQLGLSYNDVAVDHDMRGLPLLTSQKAFSLPRKDGVTHRLVLQDDLILNPYLMESIQALVNRFPDNPIALYTYKREEHDADLKQGVYKLHFIPGLAIIMPLKVMDGIIEVYKDYPLFRDDDWFYSWYCKRNDIKCYGVIPNLVTLNWDFESTLGNNVLKRYKNKIYTDQRVDIASLKLNADTYGDKYINLTDREFNRINDDCCRRSNSN